MEHDIGTRKAPKPRSDDSKGKSPSIHLIQSAIRRIRRLVARHGHELLRPRHESNLVEKLS